MRFFTFTFTANSGRVQFSSLHIIDFTRGGGGTQIWFRRGCATEAAKPVPIFKGHFGGKGYPLLGFFIQGNDVSV